MSRLESRRPDRAASGLAAIIVLATLVGGCGQAVPLPTSPVERFLAAISPTPPSTPTPEPTLMVEIVEVGGPALEQHVATALGRSAQAGQCLFERSADSGVTDVAKYEAMAARLGGASGLLEDGRSFLGPLVSAADLRGRRRPHRGGADVGQAE